MEPVFPIFLIFDTTIKSNTNTSSDTATSSVTVPLSEDRYPWHPQPSWRPHNREGETFVHISDIDNQAESVEKLINHYQKEIKFFMDKLSNKNFIKKAPSKIVDEQKKKLKDAEQSLKLLLSK